MKFQRVLVISVLTCLPFLAACTAVNYADQGEKMTIAKVQKEIKIGMSSSEVVEVLGSPNMVTTDSERRETWVYDKVSTNITSSKGQRGVWLVLFGAGSNESFASKNQRTLTVIVKFDKNNLVRDFAYRTSSF